jgi:uncharacterized Zn-binding protein involved in type VI secretion
MLKHAALAAFLCTIAMGFNSIAQDGSAVQRPQPSAQSVTNGSTTLIEQGSYVNRDGVAVHRPAHTVSGAVPAGASAQCRDGSYSFSTHHSGTCSHHGGVSQWL